METAEAARERPPRSSLRRLTTLRSRKAGGSQLDGAFESFYRQHASSVYQYALAVLANPADAEDVTQQTFLNAYRAFQRGDRPEKPHNWLITIAHNVCRMRWRQAGRRPAEVPLEHVAEPAVAPDEGPSVDEVLEALGELPFNQRAAIVMREVEGRNYREIAEVLQTTVPAVEALLFRARQNLRLRRKALGVLGTVPLPSSLATFFGGGGVVAAAGGVALTSDLALKAAAVVAGGVVAGGAGYKAVDAIATREPAARQAAKPILVAHAPPQYADPVVALFAPRRARAATPVAPGTSPLRALRRWATGRHGGRSLRNGAATAPAPAAGGAGLAPAAAPTAASTGAGASGLPAVVPPVGAAGGRGVPGVAPPATPTVPVAVPTPTAAATAATPTLPAPVSVPAVPHPPVSVPTLPRVAAPPPPLPLP
jgi:RNA polymerase sigma-70 factor (ECF subfamily)